MRRAKRMLRRIPLIVRLEGAALVVALVAALSVPTLAGHAGYERVAFAVPAAEESLLWRDEVAKFASRMHQVFGVSPNVAQEFSGWILEAARRHHLSAELVASVVFTESSFRKDVVSHVGAVGPAQVRPGYWSAFCGNANLQDPAENIYCGAQVLSHLRDRCGAERCALQAYNIGLHNRDEAFVQAGHRYVAKIDRHLERFDNTVL